MKTRYIFNKTTPVNPVDRLKNYIEVNYDNEAIINQSFPQVGIKNVRFAREDVSLFKSWMIGTYGAFYAPYFDIDLLHGSNTYSVPLYFDLTDGLKYSRDGVEASIKLYMSLDWLNDVVDGFTFDSIASIVESGDNITPAIQATYDFVQAHTIYVPYVISTIPNYLQAFSGLLSVFSMIMMLEKEVDVITSMFAPNAAGIFTSAPAAIGFFLHIAYIILMAFALIETFLAFVFSVIQPIKYHAGMLLSDLIQATCIYLGVEFQSSVWNTYPYNQLALIPEKYIPVANGSSSSFSLAGYFNLSYIVGGYVAPNPSEQQGYPLWTGGDVLRLAKKLMNGKILLWNPALNSNYADPTLQIERRDYNPKTPKYQMPDIREDWNGYNTSEFNATVLIRFAKDLNDKNTMDQFQGQLLSSVTIPTNQPDPLCVLAKGLREIDIPAARGVRKENLTLPEEIMNALAAAMDPVFSLIVAGANGVIDVINGVVTVWNDIIKVLNDLDIIDNATKNKLTLHTLTHITNPFNNPAPMDVRKGCLLMEHDLVNVAKVVMLDTANPWSSNPNGGTLNGQKVYPLHPMNSSIVNALNLWNSYYLIDSWVPLTGYSLPTYTDTQGNGCSTPPPATADKGKHNQYTLWSPANNTPEEENKLSLGFEEFILLAPDNNFQDSQGNPVIVDSLKWHFEESWADLQYRKNELYTGNLTNTITLPNGQ